MTQKIIRDAKASPKKVYEIKKVLEEVCIEDEKDKKRKLSKEEFEAKRQRNIEKISSVLFESRLLEMQEKTGVTKNKKENKNKNQPELCSIGEYKIYRIEKDGREIEVPRCEFN